MKHPSSCCLRLGLILLLLIPAFTSLLQAEQFGIYTYTVTPDNTITITKAADAVGDVTVPTAIAGKLVTSIQDSAFHGCGGLTGPASHFNRGRSLFSAPASPALCRGI